MNDFAIARRSNCGADSWSVVYLAGSEEGRELPAPLASFGERNHAEAFLRDLLLMVERPIWA